MRASIRKLPSAEVLHGVLDYLPSTGRLIWKARSQTNKANKAFNSKYAGKPAGSIAGDAERENQYLVVGITVDGKYQQYKAHRVVWKMTTGEEPPDYIDHKDRDFRNLKWENLRAATNGENIQNAKLRRDNSSGVKGVSWDRDRQRWLATIAVNKRYLKIGRFRTIEAAKQAIEEARKRLHGDFARLS